MPKTTDDMIPDGAVQVPGQTVSAAGREKLERRISAATASDHREEADRCSEELLSMLQEKWGAAGFTKEQSVFSIATVTIHLRETFPGGKEMFDEICREARIHYDTSR